MTRDWNGGVTWTRHRDRIVHRLRRTRRHGSLRRRQDTRGARLRTRTARTTLPWVGYRSRKWEPEPLRWLGVHGMYRLFGLADQWEERRDSTKTSLLAKFGSRLAGLHE